MADTKSPLKRDTSKLYLAINDLNLCLVLLHTQPINPNGNSAWRELDSKQITPNSQD